MVSHRSHIFFHCFSIVYSTSFSPPFESPQCFFHNFSSNFTQSSHSLRDVSINLSFHLINFPVFCHGVTRFLHHYPYVTSVCLTLTQIHLPQSLPLHRINGFVRFFHGFISVLLLHSGHTSKPQFFHCFYAIMVPHRSLNFSIVFPSLRPLVKHIFQTQSSYTKWCKIA